MKKIISLKFLGVIIAVATFTMVLKSCKKVDNNGIVNTKEAEASKAAIVKAIQEKYGNVSAGIIFNVNKTADEYFYKDAAGKMVSIYGSNTSKGGNPDPYGQNPLCQYDCSNTSNPANLYISYNLDYVQRFYGCESSSSITPTKSTLFVKWTVSVPFYLTYPDQTDLTCGNSYGKVIITPSTGPVVTFQTVNNSAGINIKYIGQTPLCNTGKTYEVTYKIELVDNAYFASGSQIAASVTLGTTCSLVNYAVSSSAVTAPTFSQNAYLPCNRIDKVYIIPGTGPNNCTTASGNYSVCSYPSGLSPIDDHQLEYRQVTSSTSFLWDDQTGSTPAWGIPAGTSTPLASLYPYGVSNLTGMTPNTGFWLVRYRNVKTGTCNTIGTTVGANWGNTALWTTEILYL